MTIWKQIGLAALLSLMVMLAEANDGKVLFQQHCSACHGQEGKGGIGLPLSKPAVMESLTDDYIRKTIRSGRPGRIMPAFEKLENAEVDAIVTYMRAWGISKVAEPLKPLAGNSVKGKPLFEQNCAACHGKNLSGGTEGTGVTFSRKREMPIMPPALNNAGFLGAATDGMLRYIIQHGRTGTPMPGFGGTLEQAQVDDIIAYVRASELKHDAEEKALEGESLTVIYEVSGTFAEVVDRVREAIRSNNFRVFPDRFLEEGLTDEFSVNTRQISLRFCNFNQLYEALKLEPRLGVILPCALTVIENEDGSVKLVAANVEMMARLFNNDQLDEVFINIKDSYDLVLDEVTL
ncbi:MAG: c-type cytochrome [Gammaproteobacteria bacterium]|nr:c-type cytochrome [Gammaproteobacteria bacterium]MBU2007124.1 c-type cytochrome [Gammaproteobacteria bacterium]